VADLRAPTPSAAAELAVNDYTAFVTRLTDYGKKLTREIELKLSDYQNRVKQLKLRLFYASPVYQLKQKRQNLMDAEQKLAQQMDRILREKRHKLEVYIARLEGLSPLSKLSKGYALITGEDRKPIQSVQKVRKDEILTVSLLDGEIKTRVEEVCEIQRGC
jgi:exodeoxyribonuclease VII large subunit